MREFLICLFVVPLVLASAGYSQTFRSLKDFRVFTPLKTNRAEVETLLGNGSHVNNEYFVTYFRDGLRISVDYALGDCGSGSTWNIPEWTVTEITYSFLNQKPKLKSILTSRRGFRYRRGAHVPDHLEFYNETEGILILYDRKVEGVMDVVVRPTTAQVRKHKCPDE